MSNKKNVQLAAKVVLEFIVIIHVINTITLLNIFVLIIVIKININIIIINSKTYNFQYYV